MTIVQYGRGKGHMLVEVCVSSLLEFDAILVFQPLLDVILCPPLHPLLHLSFLSPIYPTIPFFAPILNSLCPSVSPLH